MAAQEEKVIRLRVDTTEAERNISNMATRLTHTMQSRLMQFGQVAAFGLVGYGAYRLYQSQFGQSVGGAAVATLDNVRSAVGLSSPGVTTQQHYAYAGFRDAMLGTPMGFDGVSMNPAATLHYGARDLGQRTGAGLVGALTGTGLTAAMFAGGWALNRLGVWPRITAGAAAAGASIGAGVLGGSVNLAGRVIGGTLRTIGFGALGDAVTRGFGFAAAGASNVGRVVGGFLGTSYPIALAAGVVSRLGERIATNVANVREIQDEIDRVSYRYTFGNASNIATGRGFGARDQAEIARAVRSALLSEDFLRQTDFSEIMSGIVESDLDFQVRSAEEFQRKFSRVVTVLKDIARTFEVSLEGAVSLLGDMQRSGFYTTADQAAMLFRSNALARVSGMTAQQMVEQGLVGAEQARAYGFEGAFGAQMRTSLTSMVQMRPDFMPSAEARMQFQTTVQELGGAEAVASAATELFLRLSTREDAKLALYGLVDRATGAIDRVAFEDFKAGRITFAQLMDRGATKAAANQREFELFKNESDRYFSLLEGADTVAFFGSYLESLQDLMGLEDMRSLLASLGVDNQLMRYAISETLFGGAMRSEGLMLTEEFQRIAMAEDALYRTPRGWWEQGIAKPAERFWAGVSSPFINLFTRVNTAIQDWYNENILRVGLVDVDPTYRGLDWGLELDSLFRIGQHQYEFMQDQVNVIRSIENAMDAISDPEQIRHLETLRREFESLFRSLSDGKLSAEEFRSEVQRLAEQASASSSDITAAIDRMMSNTAGLAATEGAITAFGDYLGVQETRRVALGVLSAWQRDLTLSPDATRVLEELLGAGHVTEEMFREATAGLAVGEQAVIMSQLLSEQNRNRDFRVQEGDYSRDLIRFLRDYGNMTASGELAEAVDQATFELMTRGVQYGDVNIPVDAIGLIGDEEFRSAWLTGSLADYSRVLGGNRFIDEVLIPLEEAGDNRRTGELMAFFFGDPLEARQKLLESYLQGLPAEVRPIVERYFRDQQQAVIDRFEASAAAGGLADRGTLFNMLREMEFDAGYLSEVFQDLGVDDPELRAAAERAVGRSFQLWSGFGVGVDLPDAPELHYRSLDINSVLDSTYSQMVPFVYRLRLRKDRFKELALDDDFRLNLLEAVAAWSEGRVSLFENIKARILAEGDTSMTTFFNLLESDLKKHGVGHVMEFLGSVEQFRTVDELNRIGAVMTNRWSALQANIFARADATTNRESEAVLRAGAHSLGRFITEGNFADFRSLYGDENLIQTFSMLGLDVEARALRLGQMFYASGDFDEARERVLSGAQGLFHPERIAHLQTVQDRDQFEAVLNRAIASVIHQSTMGSGGPQTIYYDQDAVSDSLARVIGQQLGTPLHDIARANSDVASMLFTLNTTMNNMNTLLEEIKRRGW